MKSEFKGIVMVLFLTISYSATLGNALRRSVSSPELSSRRFKPLCKSSARCPKLQKPMAHSVGLNETEDSYAAAWLVASLMVLASPVPCIWAYAFSFEDDPTADTANKSFAAWCSLQMAYEGLLALTLSSKK